MIKEYVIPQSEVVLVRVKEITAENLAEALVTTMKESQGVDAVIRVYESDTSWAQYPAECD